MRRMCKLVQIRNRITTSDQVLDAFGESYIHSRQLKLNSTPIFRVHKNNERIKKKNFKDVKISTQMINFSSI